MLMAGLVVVGGELWTVWLGLWQRMLAGESSAHSPFGAVGAMYGAFSLLLGVILVWLAAHGLARRGKHLVALLTLALIYASLVVGLRGREFIFSEALTPLVLISALGAVLLVLRS
jgi:hypothetical protein